jgi:hypothetical protein
MDVAIFEDYILLAMMSSELEGISVEATIEAFNAVMTGAVEAPVEGEDVEAPVEGEEVAEPEIDVPDEGVVEEDGAEGSDEAVG